METAAELVFLLKHVCVSRDSAKHLLSFNPFRLSLLTKLYTELHNEIHFLACLIHASITCTLTAASFVILYS